MALAIETDEQPSGCRQAHPWIAAIPIGNLPWDVISIVPSVLDKI